MSKSIYILEILSPINNQISQILNIESNSELNGVWRLELKEKEFDEYLDPINYFLDLLKGNYGKLKKIGVLRSDICIWFLYEYNNQCNIEFISRDLKRLGDNEISLCISCWESPR